MMNEMTEDILLGRVTGGEDREDRAWREIEQAASVEPGVWERTARALHTELGMRQTLDGALDRIDQCEIPEEAFAQPRATDDVADNTAALARARHSGDFRISPAVTHWSGWAVAAMIAIAWLGVWTNRPLLSSGGGGAPLTAGAPIFDLASLSPDEAYDAYRLRGYEEGRLVQELPMLMVETRPVQNGAQIEVFYIRQTLERATVDSVFSFTQDETGQTRFVPVPNDRLLRPGETGSPL